MKGPSVTGASQMLVAQYGCIAPGDGHFKVADIPGNQCRNWFICSFLKYIIMRSYPTYKMHRRLIEMLYVVLFKICFMLMLSISRLDSLSINENRDHTLLDIEVNKYLHE